METKTNPSKHSSPGLECVGTLGEEQYCFPTTIAQQTFWFLDQLERGNPAWNIAVRFRIRGPLDVSTLDRALNEIVTRHEILRTTFSLIDAQPRQIVHATAAIPLPVDDLSRLAQSERDAEEERLSIQEGERRFDLKNGPLIRARLLKLAEQEHMLLVTMHHIVSDGWSIGIFSDEVAAHYSALAEHRRPVLPELPFQFADYAIWQNDRTQKPALDIHRAYWKSKLAVLPPLEIPLDHPRPALKTHNGYILSTVLPVPLTDTLTEFSSKHGCTFYTTALAVLKMLVQHYTLQNDVYVGTLLAGRDRVELEPLIGLFISTVVLRTDLSGDPKFPELLARVKKTVEEGLEHQDLHFQQVVELLRPKRDPSRPIVYGINFIYQRDFVKPSEFAGLSMTPVPSKSPGAIYDINFFMVQRTDGWRLSCEYNYDLYDAASVNRMLGQMRDLFEQIVKDPSRRISEFSFPADVGEPVPPFAPHTKLSSSRTPATPDIGSSSSGNKPMRQPLR
ncbi:MAG TPA: condensation domain-containing protein [Candidatus Acidoferrales bacterium]|nr:condensation domain-containing protein [Candidatus Acidoferrales bacterium]